MDSDLPTSPAPRQRLFSWDLLLVFSGVIAARAWLLFSTPFMPGMNGAYYLVQARALIERGVLGIPDLPLTFVLQSLLARAIHLVSGLSWDSSILYAVKTADSALPALIVFPIAWTVRGFGGQAAVPRWLPPLAAFALGASSPLLGMVGDFEKNSLGLGWLAFLVWRLAAWIQRPTARNAGWAILWLGLIGITHIGVFGTSILLTASIVGVALLMGRGLPKMSWGLIAGGALIMALAALVVFGFFDPSRVQKLLAAFAHPLDFLHGANRPGPPGGGMPRMPGGGMPPGMPGMPGGGGPLGAIFGTWERFVPYAIIGGLAITLAWFKRRSLTVAQIATAVGCAVTMILMTGPWVQGDKVMRFNLMVMPPAVLCAAFVLAQIRQPGAQGIFTGMALLAMLNTSYPRLMQGGQPILAPEALTELASLRDTPLKPDRTLISAQHGVEWWTAWFLHTRIVQPQALKVADWSNYDFVWFLQAKSGMQGPMMRPPGSDRGDRPPMGRERPPGMMGGGGPGGPMMGPGIPEGSEIFHDGEHFRLAWVQSPPDSLAVAPPPTSLAPP